MTTIDLIQKAQTAAAITPVDGDAQRGTLGGLIRKFGGTPPADTGKWRAEVERKQWVYDLQKLLGFDEPHCDGRDGPMTWTAVLRKLGVDVNQAQPTQAKGIVLTLTSADVALLDPHTAKWLPTLHPAVQPLAFAHWKAARAAGTPFRITSGLRSYEESDRLYWEHVHNHGPQAVPGGYSFHNFDSKFGGCAYDFTLWDEVHNKPLWDSVPGGPNYVTVAKTGEHGGMYCGFRFGDEPHMEFHAPWTAGMTEGQITAELRRRHNNSIDPVV